MPHLCLNGIVRNEADRITRMLDSVKSVISTFAILDTGSTDNTIELIEEWSKTNNIPGIVGRGAFVNFSQARNQALDLGRSWHCLPTTPWFTHLLLVDADMVLTIEDASAFDGLAGEAYEMVQAAGTYSYNNVRLLSTLSGAKYVGVTHEYLTAPSSGVIAGASFVDYADGANRTEKAPRDIALFEKDLETDPDNGRTWFYLGNTYRDIGNFAEAERCYRRKLELPTWDEEDWLTRVNLANCLEAQGREDAYLTETLKAYQARPSRAEPLHALAKHYRLKGEQATALLFAEKGLTIARPKDKLFIEDWVYDWGFKEEYSICGFYEPASRKRAFELTNELALDPLVPEHVRRGARNNMVFYLRPLKEFCPSYRDNEIGFTPPRGFTAMNPSVTNRTDGSLEVLVRTVNYKINDQGQYMIGPKSCWDAPIETENWLVRLDDKLRTREAEPVVWMRPPAKFDKVIGLEDMRIFWHGGVRQFVACAREGFEQGQPYQVHGKLLEDPRTKCTVVTDDRVISDPTTCEKNWAPVPWAAASIQCFMYRLDVALIDRERRKQPCDFAVDNISGGSQFIPFRGGQLAVVHEATAHPAHGRRVYQHRFAYLDYGLRLCSLSVPFVFREIQIEFAAGLAQHDGSLVISFGERDAKAWLCTVAESEVAAMVGIAP